MRFIKFLFFIILISFSLFVRAECININGLAFEKISYDQLLDTRGGKNIAIIRIGGTLPGTIGQFRFFAEQLCSSGAEDKFHIDGRLFSVMTIQLYK